ncbi:MAG TPA: substrate-binding protein [Bauldia sp.]|nr:substrate-binding protein [Bauldia sp.]
MTKTQELRAGISRRAMLAGTAGLAGAAFATGLPKWAFADDYPALGTFPAGQAGDSVFVGIDVPLTGTYAAAGADEQKGIELAIEHLNNGDDLIKAISPKTTKGVLGKKVTSAAADEAAKADLAVQNATKFVQDNKASLLIGSVSSGTAVALNHFAQEQKVIYLPGISGSNDTTGKDCTRYSFRSCFYAYSASAALAPVLIKELGKDRKAAYLTPDYTYGHTVYDSMTKFTEAGGWKTVTNQLFPLGATDYSAYALNIANSGADTLVVIGFGNDAVNSIKQAQQFGLLDKMKLVVPYMSPYLVQQVGQDLIAGVYAGLDFYWDIGDKFPLAKQFVDKFEAKYGAKPEWGAHAGYLQIALWADAVETAGTFYPPKIIEAYESGKKYTDTTVGPISWRAADHQLIRPVIVVQGKKAADMKGKDDYYQVVEIVPGDGIMQDPSAFGCKMGDAT